MDIQSYVDRAGDMRAEDKNRDDLFQGIDDMWHGNWSLPAGLKDKLDIREIIDLSPHDALKSGTSILSTSMPHWIIQPLSQGQSEQERAENIAYAIDYNYRKLNQRTSSPLLWDMVHSCLRYDAVASWLDYLPYQFGKSPTLRQKHALRGGNFAATVYNPKTVHVQKDTYGLNCVLLCTNMTAQEVVSKWGERASKIKSQLDKDEDTGTSRFIYNDMMLYEGDSIKRIVWGNIAEGTGVEESSDEFIIMNEVVETPFMPWIVRVGGSGLETLPEYSVHPLLAPLYLTHKWLDLNAFQSLAQSEIVKLARAPRVLTKTNSGDGVDIDYQDGASVNVLPNEDAQPWRPAPIDPNLLTLIDRVRSEVSSATLPRILQNPEFSGDTPFASINAMIQTALGGLNPAQRLCEGAHEELALRMAEWCVFAKKPLLAYRNQKSIQEETDLGSMIEIPYDQLDPESFLIKCKLFAEAPTDFNQRLNAGILMNEKLSYPISAVLEDLGKENVDSLFDQWVQEQMDKSTVATDIQATQMAALQPQQPPQQSPQQPQGGGYPGNSQGTPLMQGGGQEGQGYNANGGGMNPSTGNPGVNLREQISGQDVTGAPIQGVPQ